MTTERITPKLLWLLMTIQLTIWLILELPYYLPQMTRGVYMPAEAIKTIGYIISFVFLYLFSIKISHEHRNTSSLHIAWILMAVYAVIFIIRMIVITPLLNYVFPGYYPGPLYGLLHHITVFTSKGIFIISLFLMCSAYYKTGLGFHIKKRDYAIISGLLILPIAIMFYRSSLSQARSPYEISKYLQQSAQFQTAIMAAIAIVLRRITIQMGGGELEVALRFLILHAVGSGLFVLSEVLCATYSFPLNPLVNLITDLGWQFAFWCPALAASYRIHMTSLAEKEIEILERKMMSIQKS